MTYYISRFDSKGKLQNFHPHKQFVIDQGSEVRFELDYGLFEDPEVVVNFPDPETGMYTNTQPFYQTLDGSKLNQTYMCVISPTHSSFCMTFKVNFKHSGSFFIQISHGKNQLTDPMYINVAPKQKVKELSVLTVMSRCLGQLN